MDTHSPPPASNGEDGVIDIHQPFTPAERIRQLGDIDKDITSLLTHLSSAMRALATPPGTTVPPPNTSNPLPTADADADPLSAFQQAQSAFFNTVDRVDKQLTRQILALEEAGIITLRNNAAANNNAASGGQDQEPGPLHEAKAKAAAAGPKRLEPDGMGRYGNLDVGKLNLASSTVERDMEGELWRRMREELERSVGGGGEEEGERMEE